MSRDRLCPCGSGKPRHALTDAAGIFCAFVCDACEDEKRSRYRPEVFSGRAYAASGREEDLFASTE